MSSSAGTSSATPIATSAPGGPWTARTPIGIALTAGGDGSHRNRPQAGSTLLRHAAAVVVVAAVPGNTGCVNTVRPGTVVCAIVVELAVTIVDVVVDVDAGDSEPPRLAHRNTGTSVWV